MHQTYGEEQVKNNINTCILIYINSFMYITVFITNKHLRLKLNM